jgi:hypothetical protein
MIFMLAGFASTSDVMREQLKTLPQHYSQFDVNMAWDVKTVGGNTVINGVVRNIRYASMEDLEIWVALHDAKGKLLGRAVSFVIPRRLDMDVTAPFDIKLPMVASPGSKFIFTYKYAGSDGGGNDGTRGGGVNWMQSFESSVTGSR